MSPWRASLCNEEFRAQVKHAKKIKERATQIDGVIIVVDLVHIPLDVVVQTKVNEKNIMAVVVRLIDQWIV